MSVQDAPGGARHATVWLGFTDIPGLWLEMVNRRMAFDSTIPPVIHPDAVHDQDVGDQQSLSESVERYLRARERRVTDHGNPSADYVPGIPVHKLYPGDDDQWRVTARECAEALAAYDAAMQAGATHPPEFGEDWIPFLRLAARHGGFRTR